MSKRSVLLIFFVILIGSLCGSIRVVKVEASETTYIRADGSIDPPTANIASSDNVTYTLISSVNESIVIERSNIVVDGKGYTVEGPGSGTGIDLSDQSNVTVTNLEVRAFERGVLLNDSTNNTITANTVSDNEYGIVLYGSSSNNTLRHNDVFNNSYNLGIHTAFASGFLQNIDDSNTVNGKPVYYWINRRDMVVPLDAGYVVLVNCTRIIVKDLNLTHNMQGIALAFTTNSMIANNSIANNFDGVRLDHSSHTNYISGNNITANTHYGIRFFHDPSAKLISTKDVRSNEYVNQLEGPSCNNTIHGNTITDNGSGIRLDYPSDNTISANNVLNNSAEGIGLYGSSSNNVVSGNNVIGNSYGIWFYQSYNNWVYNNNFIDNVPQVHPSFANNLWNTSYPFGGNYWSPQYTGADIYSGVYQNETSSDGIGDTPYVQDNYPLMGRVTEYTVTSEHRVYTICNSTISELQYNGTAISFDVTGENGSAGFCRICMPTTLMNETYRVFVNGAEVEYNLLPVSNSSHSYLYFTYDHSTQQVTIIPEFPSLILLPIFLLCTLLATVIYRRRKN
ncbi:MAG: right-handed parallel beta-helix repeat-containing protein [Candidatus Bathyarchaeota archaeon]|nr:MAG: right-handed parallel beta-helix repeat-containing protein [Candidatus Bathyarchaeota archaeon]